MDNVLTTIFVVPTGNTLPTGSNSTNTLTSGQVGVFGPDNLPATVGTVGSDSFIYIAQGRNIYFPGEGTKKSDKIYTKNVLAWYKVTGNLEQNTQVTEISALNVGYGTDVSVTLRLFSYYINAAYNNGLTRSVMVTTPCIDCGSSPCDTLSAADYQATMQALAQAINDDEILNQFVSAGTDGTGLSTIILIQALTLQQYGPSCDLTNFPYQFDRMWFFTYVMSGPELTTDYEVNDACNVIATTTILQRSSYPQGTPAETKQLELDNFFNQAILHDITSNPNYNAEFQTYVDSALAYDYYYIKFTKPGNHNWLEGMPIDETVLFAFPKADSGETSMVAILTAFLGTPVNETATPTTSSSFTTSSTTTTSSTVFVTP